MGKSTINDYKWQFSIAMLVCWRVTLASEQKHTLFQSGTTDWLSDWVSVWVFLTMGDPNPMGGNAHIAVYNFRPFQEPAVFFL